MSSQGSSKAQAKGIAGSPLSDLTRSAAPEPSPVPLDAFLALMSGHAVVRCVAIAADLGLADLMRDGPATPAALAAATGSHEPALLRLLRGLSAVGVFEERAEPLRFGLTPLSARLLSDRPGSMRDFARLRGSALYWRAWEALGETIATGESAFARAHGTAHFNHLDRDPEASALFDRGVASLTAQTDTALVAAYDFSRFRRLIDVGGGRGGLLAAILASAPGLRAVLFDRPDVVAQPADALMSGGMRDRCEIVGGDFLGALPSGDAVLLSRVLHDWDDERALVILRNCRAAMPGGGTLLVVEYVLDDGPSGAAARLFDLHMLAYFGAGGERDLDAYRALLERAGFAFVRSVPTEAGLAVIEATAAPINTPS